MATVGKRGRDEVDADAAGWLFGDAVAASSAKRPASASRDGGSDKFWVTSFARQEADGAVSVPSLGLKLRASEDPLEQFRQELLLAQLLVEGLTRRYAEAVRAQVTDERARKPASDIQRLAIRCWFDSNYCLAPRSRPDQGEEGDDDEGEEVEVDPDTTRGPDPTSVKGKRGPGGGCAACPRQRVLASLNEFLAGLGLSPLKNKDATWSRFVLRELLGLSERECRSGKDLRIEDRRSVANVMRAAQAFHEALSGCPLDTKRA